MLAYAANRRVIAERRPAPHTMLAIIAGHVAAVALLMSAKMDLPDKLTKTPLVVDFIPQPDPPPPEPAIQPKSTPQPQRSVIDRPPPMVPVPDPAQGMAVPDSAPSKIPTFDDLIGHSIEPLPMADPTPPARPPSTAARLATSGAELRPPYPASKIASGEEAVLRLRLSIDERGRVVAVEPVGAADRAFLEAARRHLIARWRYKPATEGGRAAASSAVITLRFRLEG